MTVQAGSITTKYLAHYTECEANLLDYFPGGFKYGLVIPVYQESYVVLERFKKFISQYQHTLLILVINRPDDDDNTQWAEPFFLPATLTLWQSSNQTLSLLSLDSSTDSNNALLLIDRCIKGRPLPKKQGVGLARKIGADILCSLIHNKQVQSPWIFTTDADAHLPENYFTAAPDNHAKIAAIIYPFSHCFTDPTIAKLPTLLYELSLYYYINGLQYAKSPYAYHTLGSTIAINYSHYAKVRGFPKRAAAEDFYILNKLAKTGAVVSLKTPLIQITARESTRVPFGTGPAVIKLTAKPNPLIMELYHPDSFHYLQLFLQLLATLVEEEKPNLEKSIHQVLENQPFAKVNHQLLVDAAKNLNLMTAITHCFRHGKKKSTRLQHLYHWFDGFKTLKFIHYLRDNALGTISFQQWLTSNRQHSCKHIEHLIEQINTANHQHS